MDANTKASDGGEHRCKPVPGVSNLKQVKQQRRGEAVSMNDFLIIGGGVIGLSLAYDLSSHGMRVQLMDHRGQGWQASWAGAGILPPGGRESTGSPYQQLLSLSHRLHAQWADQLRECTGIDNGYRQCGGLYVARGAGEAAALTAAMQQLLEEGVQVQSIGAHELKSLEPALCGPTADVRLRRVYLLPEEAQLRNPRHLKALRRACQLQGVQLTEGIRAGRLLSEGGRIRAIETRSGLLKADRYCVTAGAWTQQLLKELGKWSIPVRPVRGQMVLLRHRPGLLGRVINEGPRYLVPREDGGVLCGSTVEDAGFDHRTTEAAIGELMQFAGELVPTLSTARLESCWSGLRPGTRDHLPFLGPFPGFSNLWVAAGHFRSGLHLSTGTAVVMSQLMRGKRPQVDLHDFRVGRP